jgi:hypothetical protein
MLTHANALLLLGVTADGRGGGAPADVHARGAARERRPGTGADEHHW